MVCGFAEREPDRTPSPRPPGAPWSRTKPAAGVNGWVTGKSTLLALQVARFLHHGAERVDILDIRRTSQLELGDVHGVHIHKTVEDCILAIHACRAEIERRQKVAEDAKQHEYSGARRILAIEEMSTLTEEIQRHWKATKAKKDPAEPPALADLSFIASIGRASKYTLLVVMQYGSARVFGGPAVKANFAAMILMRFRAQAWRMLVGTTPIPASPSDPGRSWVVTGEAERLVQLVWATPAEVVELATSGANTTPESELIEPVPLAPPPAPAGALPGRPPSRPAPSGRVPAASVPAAWTPDLSGLSGPDVDRLRAVLAASPPAEGQPDPLERVWRILGRPAVAPPSELPSPPLVRPPDTPPFDADDTVPLRVRPAALPPVPPPLEAPPGQAGRRPKLTLVPPSDLVIGWKAAGALLEMNHESLARIARRERDDFPTGTRVGQQRAWPRDELLTWKRQREARKKGDVRQRPASND